MCARFSQDIILQVPLPKSYEMKVGELIGEGKTKRILGLPDMPGHVLVESKDRITAGDGARAHDMEGKSIISTATTCKVFELLSAAGVKSHFIKQQNEKSFIARHCHMVPIEWVTRRIATGSFLRRYSGVKEGYRFYPLKRETFYKDDANHDPQWTEEQLIEARLSVGPLTVTRDEVDIMSEVSVCVFEILEKAWASLGCTLIDMKIEFGVDVQTGELILADVIDSDSWRLWPSGDKRLMKDKQVYRDMKEVTAEGLQQVKQNFAWIADRLQEFMPAPKGRAVVVMGSTSDSPHCDKIKEACTKLGVPCHIRVSSAHKGTDATMQLVAEFEADGVPTVFIAVAGLSNGLGPVLSGNTSYPVINCPPLAGAWIAQDVWSSLRLPSGLSCTTVISPENAAMCCATIFAMNDHVIWSRLRARKLNTWVGLKIADKKQRVQQQM